MCRWSGGVHGAESGAAPWADIHFWALSGVTCIAKVVVLWLENIMKMNVPWDIFTVDQA